MVREATATRHWKWKEVLIFLAFALVPLVLGTISGIIGRKTPWYDTLNKPSFAPPPFVFGIVWPILYIFMGIAAYIALRHETWVYWTLFILQLITNLLFSPVNFRLQSLLGGAILTTLTLVLAIATTLQFGYIHHEWIAVALMIPYCVWLIFATVLSWSFVSLN